MRVVALSLVLGFGGGLGGGLVAHQLAPEPAAGETGPRGRAGADGATGPPGPPGRAGRDAPTSALPPSSPSGCPAGMSLQTFTFVEPALSTVGGSRTVTVCAL